jgi:pyruvate ferredoxin oxidoreductase beta subunit
MQTAKLKAPAGNDDYFADPRANNDAALTLAGRIVEQAGELPPGIDLLLSCGPLMVKLTEVPPEDLLGLIHRDRLQTAASVVALMHRLGGEVKKREYLLDELTDEVAKLPAFTSSGAESLSTLTELRSKGCKIAGLPDSPSDAQQALLKISLDAHMALEYLYGNLQKAVALLKRFGVRNETLNASALFHNYMSGFFDPDVSGAKPSSATQIANRAAALAKQGTLVTVFHKGDFNKQLSELSAADNDAMIKESADAYGVSDEILWRFFDAVLSQEENRLLAAPDLSLGALLQAFKFAAGDREALSHPAVFKADDPTRWHDSPLGRALMVLKQNLDWLTVSAGLKAAGELDAARKSPELKAAVEALREQAAGYAVTLYSGRDGVKRENALSELSADDLLFDLHCLAVLAQCGLDRIVDTARHVLTLVHALENTEPHLNLNELVSARLSGEAYSNILATQGLTLRNYSLVEALTRLKALADKVKFTVNPGNGHTVSIERATTNEFRKAVLLIGRALRLPNAPERVLALIRDKIVPEIKKLPKAVIAPGEHDLARVVELAASGVPARYPLRRPWKRINLDPLAYMGSGLEPGIRNCLGCPVNSLYGLVGKTALATGFEDIITYEATGCFEVYSGIWPYTGKKHATLHGVFGGAPSELLGGLAAKKARLKYAHKINGEQGAAYRANLKRTLHLGWGGDGATFDIGFGNLSGLFSRLQKLAQDPIDQELDQRALYVCYDNEGYQNTGNQYSAASSPGGHTTTNPRGELRPMGNELRKKHIVEIMAEHGATVSARMNIHRQEHITRVVNRALEDGVDGAFLHFLQPCTTGWKFTADSLTYDLAYLSEEGGLFSPVTFEHGVPYLEIYPTPRNPGDSFLKLQARFKHLLGGGATEKKNVQRVIDYYAQEWQRNLHLCGFEGEIAYADRLGYLEDEHRMPRRNI